MHSILYSLMILSCFGSFGMQQNCHPMVEIKKWQDVSSFAGKIVAYTTSSYYYGSEDGFPINGNSLKYSIVDTSPSPWAGDETGYNMSQLLKPADVPGNKALIDSRLKKAKLFMRPIDKDEITKIAAAIKTSDARFEYRFDKEKILLLLETEGK